MSVFDPDEDEWGAQRRDLHRLDEILRARLPEDSTNTADAVAHLDEDKLTEVKKILDRLRPAEDPEVTQARQTVLLDYARMEAKLRERIDSPGTDNRTRQQFRVLLAIVERDRAVVLGEAEDDDDEEDEDD